MKHAHCVITSQFYKCPVDVVVVVRKKKEFDTNEPRNLKVF